MPRPEPASWQRNVWALSLIVFTAFVGFQFFSPFLPLYVKELGVTDPAEIAVSPSGRFVYGSNRGHDSLAIFSIDAATGVLSPVGWESTQGKTPRFFALDPSGTFLYAANQDSDTIVTFRVDQATGKLTPTGQVVKAGSPSAIVFR